MQAPCACFASGKAGHMPESCAPGSPTGGLWGEEEPRWTMGMGEQH